MKNADKPAYPRPGFTVGGEGHKNYSQAGFTSTKQDGLTKREAFAMAALESGICPHNADEYESVAIWCIHQADALLEELERTKEKL